MNTDNELKELVKEKYSQIASQSQTQNLSSCCGATGCCDADVGGIVALQVAELVEDRVLG